MRELDALKSFDEMSVWITELMLKLLDDILEFAKIKHSDAIYKAISYIKNHYAEEISLKDVAEHVFLSPSYFSKLFGDELGCTFIEYVNNIRVVTSKQLLLDYSVSIAEIATLVGFADQSYYTKVFRNIVGVTPGKYREARGKI